MDIPKGFQKPHRIAELVPLLLVFLAVVVAGAFGFAHLLQGADHPDATTSGSPGAGVIASRFQPEALFGVGIVALLVALVWGVWRYRHRDRANDPVADAVTRQEYEHPED